MPLRPEEAGSSFVLTSRSLSILELSGLNAEVVEVTSTRSTNPGDWDIGGMMSGWLWVVLVPAFEFAVGEADIDFTVAASYHNDTLVRATRDEIICALGLREGKRWSAGVVTQPDKPHTFRYLIAFKHNIEIGSVLCSRMDLRYLKREAPYPPDPKDESHWEKVEFSPSQGAPRLLCFEPGFRTRALLLMERVRYGRSVLRVVRVFKRRFCNLTPHSLANAEAEYTAYPFMSPPYTYYTSGITGGSGEWRNSGGDRRTGLNYRPPVSDIDPSWFVLSWEKPQRIIGIYSLDDFLEYELYYFVGPDDVNPAVGTESKWKSSANSPKV